MAKPLLKLVHDAPPRGGSIGAMPLSEAALAPSGLSRCASQAKLPAAIAGPSKGFVSLTRNPDLEPPARFEPTEKGPNDVVI